MNILAFFHAASGLLVIILSCITPHSIDMKPLAADEFEYRIVFYNTENFFDTRNDSLTADDEFTPEGSRHWNY